MQSERWIAGSATLTTVTSSPTISRLIRTQISKTPTVGVRG